MEAQFGTCGARACRDVAIVRVPIPHVGEDIEDRPVCHRHAQLLFQNPAIELR